MKFCLLRITATMAFALLFLSGFELQAASGPVTSDLVVYGGTASGIMTAYSASREGLRVVLLEPGTHMGGMVTGGLSATDLGDFTVIGGYAREFYLRAAAHYGLHDLDQPANWLSEPHVSEEVLLAMLHEAHVKVYLHERLREHDGVRRSGTRILSLTTEDGKQWTAKVFADCSYEGDVMTQAKVNYTWGREAASEYGEDLAGVRAHTPGHQFQWTLSAYDDRGRLLPEIDPGPLATPGSGDKHIQAYNFRAILASDPNNRLPFPQPAGYNRAQFVLLERYLKEFQGHMGREPHFKDLTNPVAIPNAKADFNNNGPVSTDFIGHSWSYPEGTYAEKDAIWRQHLLYFQSFFYFLSQDASVPASLRAEVNQWGLPRDEFAATNHWPPQLYIREGRRMLGQYVMRQSDLQQNRSKPDSIGMGSYNSDSHNEQRVATKDGSVQNEGDVQVPVQPYEIAYRVITPKPSESTNLLVPVCLSATHAAYSSIRMEPQYMIIGQAAGVAAALAVHLHLAVQEIPMPEFQQKLRKEGAILSLDDKQYSSRGKR